METLQGSFNFLGNQTQICVWRLSFFVAVVVDLRQFQAPAAGGAGINDVFLVRSEYDAS
jgi:hypothetical protein